MNFSARIKHFFLILPLFAIFYLTFTTSSYAQQNQTNPYLAPNVNSDVPQNMHTMTQNIVIEVISALTCQLIGIDPVAPKQKCLGLDDKTGKIGFVQSGGGAIGLMGGLIAELYTPPLHTNDYTTYLSQNFGLTKPAYAQSLGFQSLNPLIKLWSAFRNIVYLVFVIVFIFIGLAIMLRIKIDPRTVMSIENQIPKIIIALLLVTFSFAIAGLLIDIMYIFIYLIFNIFSAPGLLSSQAQQNINSVQQSFNSDNALGVFNNLVTFQDVVTKASGAVKDLVRNLFSVSIPNKDDTFILGALRFIWDNGVLNGLALVIGGIAGLLAMLIISVAILWSLFRLWFELIKAYVFILIDVVIAPLLIVTGVFPGGLGFGGWFKDILSNLSVYPVTIAMFLLGRAFMDAFNGSSQDIFVPPLIGNPTGGQAGPIGDIIAMGIIFVTPQVVNMMKEALKAPQFKYTSAIGQSLGAGAGVLTNTFKGTGAAYIQSQEKRIKKVGASGQAEYGDVGITRAFFGRILGR